MIGQTITLKITSPVARMKTAEKTNFTKNVEDEERHRFIGFNSRLTLRFSCGARSASKLKEKDYLRNMLSRRQLRGFVMLRVTEDILPVIQSMIDHSRNGLEILMILSFWL